MKEKVEKDETFYKILSAAMELDVKKGHLKWTLSDLSRKSGITRSLIYYYFGRSKGEILNEAVKMIGVDITGMSPERIAMWKRGELAESMIEARKLYDTAPFLGAFFMEHRRKPTEMGEAIREVEKSFFDKLKSFFPQANDAQLNALFVVYWGMAFSPHADEGAIRAITHMIKSVFVTDSENLP